MAQFLYNNNPGAQDNPEEAARKRQEAAIGNNRNIQRRMVDQASQYREALPGFQEDQGNRAADQRRMQLASQMKQIKSNANSRGLLYSGLRQGAEVAAAGDTMRNIAADRMRINAALQDRANAMETGAIDQDVSILGAEGGASDSAFAAQMQQNQANQGLIAAGAGALGTLGGSYLAGRKEAALRAK